MWGESLEDAARLARTMEEGAARQGMQAASGRSGETGPPHNLQKERGPLNLDFRSSGLQNRKIINALF